MCVRAVVRAVCEHTAGTGVHTAHYTWQSNDQTLRSDSHSHVSVSIHVSPLTTGDANKTYSRSVTSLRLRASLHERPLWLCVGMLVACSVRACTVATDRAYVVLFVVPSRCLD